MDTSSPNPYESPKTPPEAPEDVPDVPRRGGPAIYIALGGLAGVFAAPLLFWMSETLYGVWMVIPGTLAGGLTYRLRSRNWPLDPTARARRLGYAVTVTLLPPGFFLLTAGLQGQGPGFVLLGLFVGVALAAGILICGDRRWRPERPRIEEEATLSDH